QDRHKSLTYSTKLAELLQPKPKPEEVSDADWQKKKTTVLGHASNFQATRNYGFVKNAQGEIRNGMPIRHTFFMGNETFDMEKYHLDVAIHTTALAQAGFSDMQWLSPKL